MITKMTDEDFLALFADDLDIAQAASESFINTFPELKAKAVSCLNGQNGVEAKNALHALKGAVSVFGNESLPTQIKKIEEIAKSGQLTQAQDLFMKLQTGLDQVYLEVDSFLKRQKK